MVSPSNGIFYTKHPLVVKQFRGSLPQELTSVAVKAIWPEKATYTPRSPGGSLSRPLNHSANTQVLVIKLREGSLS